MRLDLLALTQGALEKHVGPDWDRGLFLPRFTRAWRQVGNPCAPCGGGYRAYLSAPRIPLFRSWLKVLRKSPPKRLAAFAPGKSHPSATQDRWFGSTTRIWKTLVTIVDW